MHCCRVHVDIHVHVEIHVEMHVHVDDTFTKLSRANDFGGLK